MSEDQSSRNPRPGEGKIRSPQELKDYFGRNSFIRGDKHQGGTSNPTEELAARRLAKGQNGPTDWEKNSLFKENPQTVAIFRAQQFTDEQIFDILNNSQN